MPKEPKIIDLVFLHLKDRGFQAHTWCGQADGSTETAWISVNSDPQPSLFISTKGQLINMTDVYGKYKHDLDPFDPEMFDKLDNLIRAFHGGNS